MKKNSSEIESSSASSASSSSSESIEDAALNQNDTRIELHEDAKKLLLNASKYGGIIAFVEGAGGIDLITGNKTILSCGNHRDKVYWKDRISELVTKNYIRKVTSSGLESYELTTEGYTAADDLSPFWKGGDRG